MTAAADKVADGREQVASDGEPTVRDVVAGAVDTAPESIAYRENVGTLDAPEERWHRFETVAELPDRTFDGWDELFVYTETHVYHWVAGGFAQGPDRLPRDPASLPDEN
ncbi:hypothetical protein [Halorientalis halophila]|uniref:hypothetical protein n=1 Tax=Halorientalis halophila TaxID=3108499 RepID=UPI003008B0F4